MNALFQSLVRGASPRTPSSFSVAVLYDDGETQYQAELVYESLLTELEEDVRLNATWWRTSLLGDPKLTKVAARALGAADLVLVAVHAEQGPSPRIQAWIESWPLQPDRPTRLVALILGEPVEAVGNDWETYLEDIARRRNMGFTRSLSESTMDFEKTAHRPEQPVEPYAHWGLNE